MKQLGYIFFLLPLAVWSQGNFEKGEQLFKQEQYAMAAPYFESFLNENPNNPQTMEYLGDIAAHQKKWDKAIANYKKLKTQFPKNAGYQYKYGGALGMKAKESSKFKALGMIGEIEDSFKAAAKLDVRHIESRWALVILYLELPGIVGGSEKKAQYYAGELMAISPVDGNLSKGHIAEYFKRYTEAEKYYLKAMAIGQSKTTYQRLADLYKNKMNLPEKAKQTLDLYQKKRT
ncbi:tetratricopeptide repeat protein [Flavobacterium sp. UBA4197]|uniref:tetratricopeptide repeat protein n=1 Tax=Flavobacterium sp. UBA4197 TaxID=1946546 RepID=UPI00257D3C7B|nr:tetratricopeptide repeat protein [Flavobacterium sp. UBA4197]